MPTKTIYVNVYKREHPRRGYSAGRAYGTAKACKNNAEYRAVAVAVPVKFTPRTAK